MGKLDMVYIIGSELANARTHKGMTQQDLAAAYEVFRQQHKAEYPSARKMDNSELSRIESSTPGLVAGLRGGVPSRHKRQTAEALARLLNIDPLQIIQEIVLADSANADEMMIFVDNAPDSLGKSNVLQRGTLLTQPSVELPFISVPARASFVEMGGTFSSFPPLETRRVYLRGAPATMYDTRIVFEVDGDSMEPYINSGDEVIAVEVPEGRWDTTQNCVVVVSYVEPHGSGVVTIKKIIGNDLLNRSTLTLRPYRDELAPHTVRRNEIRAIFRVEEVMPRTFKARL